MQATFPSHKVKDGDVPEVGKIKLKFPETPGYSPEGITILAENTDDRDEPFKIEKSERHFCPSDFLSC